MTDLDPTYWLPHRGEAVGDRYSVDGYDVGVVVDIADVDFFGMCKVAVPYAPIGLEPPKLSWLEKANASKDEE